MSLEKTQEIFDQARKLEENLEFTKAIELLRKIEKEDSVTTYANAQFHIGLMFQKQKNYQEAEAAYKEVSKEGSSEYYAKAQNNLGVLFKEQGEYKDAEVAYKNVFEEGNPQNYATAQLNLGILFQQQERVKEAEAAYRNISRNDSPEYYATAQLNLGILFQQQEMFEDAEAAYRNISRNDHPEYYAKAQNNLGILLKLQEKYIEAEIAFKKVSHKDNHTQYAKSLWNLAFLLEDVKYLKKIKKEGDEEIFYKACFLLGKLSRTTKQRKEYWGKISKKSEIYLNNSFMISNTFKIVDMVKQSYQSKFFEILDKTNLILESLFVELEYENLIAHYTNIKVSKLLISHDHKDLKVKSLLRLNTINLMNDPVEGKLLYPFLGVESKSIEIDRNEQAFIACFTLHHDSLNQFRLYGKDDEDKEASGLSLVLNKKFFSDKHNAANIYKQLNKSESSQSLKESIKLNEELNNKEDEEITKFKFSESQKPNPLPLMPLYRCIYLDPTSDFIKVAQREEWSFCREDEEPSSERWIAYSEEVLKIKSEVKGLLGDLSQLIEKIPKIQLETKTGELLNEILLPLQYLVKHMAFKEEQECRMVYVTQMDSDLVQFDERINRVYIDYEPSVMQHLEKIYLAPKAKDEQTIFEYLCAQGQKLGINQKGVKVKISQNPFR